MPAPLVRQNNHGSMPIQSYDLVFTKNMRSISPHPEVKKVQDPFRRYYQKLKNVRDSNTYPYGENLTQRD